MSRSCSCSAKASSLLSIQEAAATSRGVDPRIPEQIAIFQTWILHRIYSRTCFSFILKTASHTQANATVLKQVWKMVEHGALVLTTDTTEIAQEAAAVCHHLGESNLLLERVVWGYKSILALEQIHWPKKKKIFSILFHLVTFESPPPPRTLTMTSITVSCMPRALIKLGCW